MFKSVVLAVLISLFASLTAFAGEPAKSCGTDASNHTTQEKWGHLLHEVTATPPPARNENGSSAVVTGGWYSTKPLQNTASATADGNTYSIEPLPRRVEDKTSYDPATAVAPHPDAEPFSVVRVDANPRLQCLQYNGRINLGIIQIVWGEHECTPDP